MSTVRMEMTLGDVEGGIRRNQACCPVANTIRRCLGRNEIEVNRKRIAIDGVGQVTPDAVAAFVESFDNGRRVEPIAFELEVPA